MRKHLLVSLAIGATLMALVGCTSTASAPAESSTTIDPPAFAQFPSYTDVTTQKGVEYTANEHLDACQPQKAASAERAAVIVVHGGTWRRGNKADASYAEICQWLAHAGFVAFDLDYRLAPEHPFPAGFDDVRASVRWIRSHATKYDVDPARIGAFGGSAGGSLVSLLGTYGSGSITSGSRVAAVVELSGPANLTSTGAEEKSFIPDQLQYLHCGSLTSCPAAKAASPLFHVDPSDPPFFVAHSLEERIPLSQSDDFVKALRTNAVRTTFVTVRGDLHSVAMLSPKLRKLILTFLQSNLA
ncbi:MAG: alpha/beta hydrolase [Microbacteriaceae bacterium]|nr:alpha/beta hydrolase [Microbacteriaceae bacterium]